MNKKPLTVTSIAAVFAALTLLSACDKRDSTASPPTPSTTPSPSTTTPSTTPPATGGTGMTPSDSGASAPGMGASK